MTTDRTMRTAQQLYEGIDVGQGAIGLITYMRTDSVTLSEDALVEIRHYIENKLDKNFLPSKANVYKTKSKNAQEAHEAIRPTSIYRTPEEVKPFLNNDQFRLYQMIWKRTVASQMTPAKFDSTSVDIEMGNGIFRTTGQIQTFAGFLSVYEEDTDDDEDGEEGSKNCQTWPKAMCCPLTHCAANNTLPNRRHAIPKPHWSKPWKNLALVALRLTPALFRP